MDVRDASAIISLSQSLLSYKTMLAVGITCISLFLLTSCDSNSASVKGQIVAQPVTESEIINPQATDAVTLADQSTDYPYVDITPEILAFIDGAMETFQGTASEKEQAETIQTLAQNVYNKMPDLTKRETGFDYFEDACFDAKYNAMFGVPLREDFEVPTDVIVSAQEAVNQAVVIIKSVFVPDCKVENVYLHYSPMPWSSADITNQNWTVYVVATLANGNTRKFVVRIDAYTGALQRAGDLNEDEIAEEKEFCPVTKENYENYAKAVHDYLIAAGVPIDETVKPVVRRFASNSKYAILYTTTAGALYRAFLYTDGSCAYIDGSEPKELLEHATIIAVEDMLNYELS